MLASYLLSRTLIPTMVHYMLKPEVKLYASGRARRNRGRQGRLSGACTISSTAGSRLMRASYTGAAALVASTIARRCSPASAIFVIGFARASSRWIGSDFFPTVDSGPDAPARARARRAPASKRRKSDLRRDRGAKSAASFPPREIDTIIDNIGIPNRRLQSGATATTRPSGPSDGDILISLNPEEHGPTAEYTDRLRKHLHQKFPDVVFLLRSRQHHQPDSELRPARADRRAGGRPRCHRQLRDRPAACSGASRAFPAPPTCTFTRWWTIRKSSVNVDRNKAGQLGLTPARRQPQPADLAQRQRPDRAQRSG